MKRFPMRTILLAVALMSLILCVSACTVASNSNNTVATNGNTNAPLAATNANTNTSNTGDNAALIAEVTAKEKQLWDTLKNRDYDAFDKMLSSDSVYVSSDVVSFDKAATVNGVKNFAPSEVSFSDWKSVVLDKDAVVVTYTLNVKDSSSGQPASLTTLRASTAWMKRGAEWLAVYHQDSPIEETPTATPAAETSKPAAGAANSNTNPAGAAKHAEMGASDDPLAMEKHLWEVLKQRDWDTFASHLADDQLEVGSTGVHDKAATLNAIKQWDFSKATPGDFKATKLDDDATLVTYTIKGTGPDSKPFEERTSSIWVKRGDKWLAAFHMGTPVSKMPSK